MSLSPRQIRWLIGSLWVVMLGGLASILCFLFWESRLSPQVLGVRVAEFNGVEFFAVRVQSAEDIRALGQVRFANLIIAEDERFPGWLRLQDTGGEWTWGSDVAHWPADGICEFWFELGDAGRADGQISAGEVRDALAGGLLAFEVRVTAFMRRVARSDPVSLVPLASRIRRELAGR